ncbi:putative ribonuclease H-like domain-containing protein [Tanacetum coccineum]
MGATLSRSQGLPSPQANGGKCVKARVKSVMGLYVVPTGRVYVPTGRYVVPTGKDNFKVSAGRPNMVPTSRTIVSLGSIIFGPGSKDLSRVGSYNINNLDAFMPLQEVWTLVDLPNGKRLLELNRSSENKKDKRGIVIKNKARLVAQGVLFLYGKIEKEVYVCQPPGFKDPDFPDRVYKVEKVLYRLHQAPRACYETLSTYLLDNGFQRGKIDKTLFIKRDKGDILLVQVYVDDIIFGSTKKSLCTEFEKMMHKKFQMSSMGELVFFLRLQVKQKEHGIFISQDKYVTKILKKFGFTDVKTASTPMETQKPLLKDENGK